MTDEMSKWSRHVISARLPGKSLFTCSGAARLTGQASNHTTNQRPATKPTTSNQATQQPTTNKKWCGPAECAKRLNPPALWARACWILGLHTLSLQEGFTLPFFPSQTGFAHCAWVSLHPLLSALTGMYFTKQFSFVFRIGFPFFVDYFCAFR